MRPFTNRGLRRRRPPRTRATVTRIVSSPFPSLPTDTGGRYMSLSTRPFPLVALPWNELAVFVPPWIRHPAVQDVADRSNGDDREVERPGTMDDLRSNEGDAVLRIHIRGEQKRIVL